MSNSNEEEKQLSDKGKFSAEIKLEKYACRKDYEKKKPYEILEFKDDVFLNEGINTIWTLVCGGSATPFNNANSYVGVGNSSAPESATQTGLQGTNKFYKKVDDGYPIYGTNQVADWKITYEENEANFAWNEVTVANGNSDSAINLNRKVQSMGTKPAGEIWGFIIRLKIT